MSSGESAAKTKHTPGPWKFDPDDVAAMQRSFLNDPKKSRIEGVVVYTRAPGLEGSTVVSVDHEPDNGFDLLDDKCAAEIAANLTLIAAAPDLLAALSDLIDAHRRVVHGESTHIEAELLNIAQAAIAKAQGQS